MVTWPATAKRQRPDITRWRWLPTGFFKLSQDGGCRRRRARMARRFGAARRFAAAAVVMAMKSSGAAGSRLTTDGRSVLVKRPELLTTAVASEGSWVEAIVAYATEGSNPD